MTSPSTEIEKIVTKVAGFSAADQKELLDFLGNFSPDSLQLFLELFQEDSNWVRIIFKNYRAKRYIQETGTAQQAEKILKQEIDLLGKIEADSSEG